MSTTPTTPTTPTAKPDTVTFREFLESHEHLIVWYTAIGNPGGSEHAVIDVDGTLALFNSQADKAIGTVDSGLTWSWDGGDDPRDHHGNTILSMQVRQDRTVWEKAKADYDSWLEGT